MHRVINIRSRLFRDGRLSCHAGRALVREVTGELGDPYVAVYRLNDRTGAGKVAFSRSGGQ